MFEQCHECVYTTGAGEGEEVTASVATRSSASELHCAVAIVNRHPLGRQTSALAGPPASGEEEVDHRPVFAALLS